jgi:hypothetical protein
MAGAPKNLTKPKGFQVTVPKDTYDYLTLLASKGRLGSKESDVASHIIIREVDAMLRAGYHNLDFPKV